MESMQTIHEAREHYQTMINFVKLFNKMQGHPMFVAYRISEHKDKFDYWLCRIRFKTDRYIIDECEGKEHSEEEKKEISKFIEKLNKEIDKSTIKSVPRNAHGH